MWAMIKKLREKWWPPLLASWRTCWPIALLVTVVGVALWFAAHDDKLSEFVIKLTHELAWPLLLLVLLGYSYRESLNKVINRLLRFKLAGVELEAGAEAIHSEEQLYLRSIFDKADQDDKKRIDTLLNLPPAALRLLGTLVAVGLTQNLDLGRYRGPRYEQGKRHLLESHLAVLDGHFYRPTPDGVRVFSLYVDALKKKMEEGKISVV